MPNQKNIQTVENLKEKIADAKSVIFADYSGLDANQINKFRAKVKETDAELTIARNTLMKLALKENNLKEPKDTLKGQIVTIFGKKDAIAPIKAIAEFIKETKLPKIVAGFVEGEPTALEKLEILSQLPSREQLLAQVVRGLKAPITGIVNVLHGSQKKLVYALSAVADKKGEEV